MRKSSEYRKNADECRGLARKMQRADQREQLLRMAETWDQLAADREGLISKHPDLILDTGDADEGRGATQIM